jgi:hypothetical protein
VLASLWDSKCHQGNVWKVLSTLHAGRQGFTSHVAENSPVAPTNHVSDGQLARGQSVDGNAARHAAGRSPQVTTRSVCQRRTRNRYGTAPSSQRAVQVVKSRPTSRNLLITLQKTAPDSTDRALMSQSLCRVALTVNGKARCGLLPEGNHLPFCQWHRKRNV